MTGIISFKSFTGSIKDVDVKTRTVCGYFSAFGNKDSDGDVIMPGAYSKTIAENGPNGTQRIKHLLQHNKDFPLGKITELSEDNFGLLFKSQLVPTSYGLDTILLYDAGVYNEHSVGFQTVKNQAKSGYNEIQEIKLWEGSTVTWGANANTPTTSIKGMTLSKEQFHERADKLIKAIKAGTFVGDNEYLLDLSFNELKGMYDGFLAVDTAQAEELLNKSNQAEISLDPQAIINHLKNLKEKLS